MDSCRILSLTLHHAPGYLHSKTHEDVRIWTSSGCSETRSRTASLAVISFSPSPTWVSGALQGRAACTALLEPLWQQKLQEPAAGWSCHPFQPWRTDKPGHPQWRLVGCRLLFLRNLAKPPKSKRFRHVFILPCTFPKGALCLSS